MNKFKQKMKFPRRESVIDSIAVKSALILSIFAVLIIFGLAERAYAVDGFNCENVPNPVANCGFETGNFSGWIAQDLPVPFWPLDVYPGGVDVGFGLFISDPPQGVFAALTGFDGSGPGTISLAQDVVLSPAATRLSFD